jgi:hypothetical protein
LVAIESMEQNRFEKKSKRALLGVFFLCLILTVISAELILFLFTKEEDNTTRTRNIRLREYPPSSINYVIPDVAHLRNTDSLKRNKVRLEIDEDGYIYPSRVHLNPDKTIVFLGGSTTETLYVDEKNRLPYLVGRQLEKNGKRVNSFNGAYGGNHSMHSINILLNKGLALKPNIAVMMHNINDLTVLLYEKNYWNNNPTRSLLVEERSKNSITNQLKAIVKLMTPRVYSQLVTLKKNIYLYLLDDVNIDEFAHLRGEKLSVNKNDILNSFEKSLLTFVAICKSNKILPVLMTQANRFKKNPDKIIINNWTLEKDFGISYAEYKDIYDSMNNVVIKVGASSRTLVIDLAKEVPQKNTYLYDSVHYNNKGTKYAAKIVADQLQNSIN